MPTEKHFCCSNNAVTLLNAAKSMKIRSIIYQPANQPAVRPDSTSTTALEFLHNKGNRVGFMKTVVPKNVYPLHHGASFYPILVKNIVSSYFM